MARDLINYDRCPELAPRAAQVQEVFDFAAARAEAVAIRKAEKRLEEIRENLRLIDEKVAESAKLEGVEELREKVADRRRVVLEADAELDDLKRELATARATVRGECRDSFTAKKRAKKEAKAIRAEIADRRGRLLRGLENAAK